MNTQLTNRPTRHLVNRRSAQRPAARLLDSFKALSRSWEHLFALFSLLFYSELLTMQSLFALSEGEDGIVAFPQPVYNPFSPLLRLAQHGIFLVVVALLLLRWKKTLSMAKRGLFLWGLIGLVLLSFLWSADPSTTLRNSISLLETTAFGFYFAQVFSLREQLRLVSIAGIVFILGSLLYSLAFPGKAIEIGIHAGSWRGPLIQKNLFGRALVLFWLAIYLRMPLVKGLWRALSGLTLVCGAGLLWLSDSKTGLAVFVLVTGLIHLQKWVYGGLRQRAMLWVPMACGGLLAVMSAVVLFISNTDRIVAITGRDLTLSSRTEIWSALVTKISERPLLGYGYQGFWKGMFGESAYIVKVFDNTYVPPHSHNGLFELTLAFGLIGLGLFLVCLVRNFGWALQLPLRRDSASKGVAAVWPLIFLSFIVLYNQTESTLVAHNSIFWALFVAITFSKRPALQPAESARGEMLRLPTRQAQLL